MDDEVGKGALPLNPSSASVSIWWEQLEIEAFRGIVETEKAGRQTGGWREGSQGEM